MQHVFSDPLKAAVSKGREIAGAYIHTYIYTRKRRVILYAMSFYDYFVYNTYIVYAFARAHCRRASYTRFRARFNRQLRRRRLRTKRILRVCGPDTSNPSRVLGDNFPTRPCTEKSKKPNDETDHTRACKSTCVRAKELTRKRVYVHSSRAQRRHRQRSARLSRVSRLVINLDGVDREPMTL